MTVDLSLSVAPWSSLQAKLRDLDDQGYRVPCLDMPELFVSEEPTERDAAAAWCLECPALTACASYAEAAGESFHVWGGVDRGPRNYRRKENP